MEKKKEREGQGEREGGSKGRREASACQSVRKIKKTSKSHQVHIWVWVLLHSTKAKNPNKNEKKTTKPGTRQQARAHSSALRCAATDLSNRIQVKASRSLILRAKQKHRQQHGLGFSSTSVTSLRGTWTLWDGWMVTKAASADFMIEEGLFRPSFASVSNISPRIRKSSETPQETWADDHCVLGVAVDPISDVEPTVEWTPWPKDR